MLISRVSVQHCLTAFLQLLGLFACIKRELVGDVAGLRQYIFDGFGCLVAQIMALPLKPGACLLA